jgi:uncharacterized protein YbaR (Trm112 family)
VPIDPQLLQILACPVCKTAVKPAPDDTALICDTCRRRYPVVDDIPIMLVEDASIEPGERS